MPVIHLPGAERPNEYTQRFKNYSLQELINAYNREIHISAWVSARARMLVALSMEFGRRSVDSTLIGGGGGLSLAFEVEFDEQNNRLVKKL